MNAEAIGRAKARPYDLRHSFVSLLIAEGRTVIDVAQQAGHSPETCLRYYAHLFAEFVGELTVFFLESCIDRVKFIAEPMQLSALHKLHPGLGERERRLFK